MTKMNVAKNELVRFVGGFGPGVKDLKMKVESNQLKAGVALSTHFLSKAIVVEQIEAGDLIISDIAKFNNFLKAAQGTDVQLQQNLAGRNTELRITCGKSVFTIPSTNEVASCASLEAAGNLVKASAESNWKEFGGSALSCYAIVDVVDVQAVAPLGKVVGTDNPYRLVLTNKQKQGVISTGKHHNGQVFHKFDLIDPSVEDTIQTQFGPWFPEVLGTLPLGKAEIYTGENAVLVFNHQDKDCLLVVIDQRPDEE